MSVAHVAASTKPSPKAMSSQSFGQYRFGGGDSRHKYHRVRQVSGDRTIGQYPTEI